MTGPVLFLIFMTVVVGVTARHRRRTAVVVGAGTVVLAIAWMLLDPR